MFGISFCSPLLDRAKVVGEDPCPVISFLKCSHIKTINIEDNKLKVLAQLPLSDQEYINKLIAEDTSVIDFEYLETGNNCE